MPVTAALITGPQGVLLQRRPSKGLLAGLWQPLAFEGTAMTQPELDAALRAIGLCVQWQAPLQSTRSAGFAAQPQARRRRAASGPAARS